MSLSKLLKGALGVLAKLSNPTTDAAVVTLVTKLAPGVHFNLTDVLAELAAVGVLSAGVRAKLAPAATVVADIAPAVGAVAGAVAKVIPDATVAADAKVASEAASAAVQVADAITAPAVTAKPATAAVVAAAAPAKPAA